MSSSTQQSKKGESNKDDNRCQGIILRNNERCSRKAKKDNIFCYQHISREIKTENTKHITCNICFDDIYDSTYQVTCIYCNNTNCTDCLKSHILAKGHLPICSNPTCKKPWSIDFIVKNFRYTFLPILYKHIGEIMVITEKQYLPLVQQELMEEKEIAKIAKIRYRIRRIGFDIQNKNMFIERLQNQKRKKTKTQEEKLNKYIEEVKELNIELTEQMDKIPENTPEIKKKKEKIFTLPCPMNECNGYLDKKYICGICEKEVCNKCWKEKYKHVCNKDDIKTVKELTKNSKPCPGCGILTYIIDGCPQIFCIIPSCHTVWNYKTGELDKGQIHNPHYFEYMKKNKDAGVAYNHNNLPCGGLPQYINSDYKQSEINKILRRCIEIDIYKNQVTTRENTERYRKEFLLNEIDDKKWGEMLIRCEKKYQNQLCYYYIYNMYVLAANDIFGRITEKNDTKHIDNILNEFEELRKYYNEQLYIINKILRLKNGMYINKGYKYTYHYNKKNNYSDLQ